MKRALWTLGSCLRRVGVARRGTPTTAGELPLSPFEPRTLLRLKDRRPSETPLLSLLDKDLELAAPFPWQPRAWLESAHTALAELHAMEFLEALTPGEGAPLVLDWIASHGDALEGGRLAGWQAAALSRRAVAWMQWLAAHGEALAEEFEASALESLVRQVRALEHKGERRRGNLRRIEDARALLWAGRFFEGREAQAWLARGEHQLEELLPRLLLTDGVVRERSPSVQLACLARLIECRGVVSKDALAIDLEDALARMAQAAVDLTHADGTPCGFGAGSPLLPRSLEECLSAARELTGAELSARAAFAFEDAGFHGVREGQSLLVFDCGYLGSEARRNDDHEDVFSLEWSVDGRRILIDAGAAPDGPPAWREHARSSRAHSGLALCDGAVASAQQDPARAPAPCVRTRFERFGHAIVVEGAYAGATQLAGRPRPHRRITATARRLSVEDFIEGGAGQVPCARLLLHPDVEVREQGALLVLLCGGHTLMLETEHKVEVESAHWYPRLGVRQRTQSLVIRYPGAPSSGWFTLELAKPNSQQTQFLRRNAIPLARASAAPQ